MPTASPASTSAALDTLASAGIISDRQREQALEHPDFASLAAHPGAREHLLWLLVKGIVTDDELEQAQSFIRARHSIERQIELTAILSHARAGLKSAWQGETARSLKTLLAQGLINDDEHTRARRIFADGAAGFTPAEALARIGMAMVVGTERMAERRVAAHAAGGESAAIMREADAIVERLTASTLAAALSPWRWLRRATQAGVIGLGVWFFMRPPALPGCGDGDVNKKLGSMMRESSQRGVHPFITGIEEVGYASETKMRGCMATLAGSDGAYGFTISRPEGEETGFVLAGIEPEIIQARFRNLDDDGRFLFRAEPIGRAELDRAVREGMAALPMGAAAYRMLSKYRKRRQSFSHPVPAAHEMAEIEPNGSCREMARNVYACPLLIGRNDSRLEAWGPWSPTILEGEFTFERQADSGQWKVSDAFAEQLAEAREVARTAPAAPVSQ